MSDQPETEGGKKLKEAVKMLSEYFDSVQIFASNSTGNLNGTKHSQDGYGNFFMRYGQVKHWVIGEEEKTRIDIRKENES